MSEEKPPSKPITREDIAAMIEASKHMTQEEYENLELDRFALIDPDADSFIKVEISKPDPDDPMSLSGRVHMGDCHDRITWYFEPYFRLWGDHEGEALLKARERHLYKLNSLRDKALVSKEILTDFFTRIIQRLDFIEAEILAELYEQADCTGDCGEDCKCTKT